MKILIFLTLLTVSLFSDEIFGMVSKIKGQAYEIKADERKIELAVGSKVSVGSTVFTKDNSRVIIKFSKDIIVLNKNCRLFLDAKSVVSQKEGSIFYKIEPLKSVTKGLKALSKDRFKIRTRTTTIGIRGTDFVVDNSNGDQKVLLRNGRLNIASIDEEFKMYVKKEMSEFEAYKQQMEDGFKEFVDTQEYEFSEHKKEFTLEQNKMAYIKDGKVYQEEFSKEVKEMFDELDMFIEQ